MFKKIIKFLLNKRIKNINLSKYVDYDIHPSSKIDATKLYVGSSWSKNDKYRSLLVTRMNSQLIVKNKFRIFSKSTIYINKDACLTLGSGYINHNLNLSCFKSIEIGENVAISENVTIRDSDNHQIISHEHISEITKPIKIGNNVWIGMNVTILKGTIIGDNVVVAAGSIVTKSFPNNVLIGGVPAKIIKENIEWK